MNPVALAPIYLFIFPIKHKTKVLLLAKVSNNHFLSFEPFHSNKLNCQKNLIEQTKRTFFISFFFFFNFLGRDKFFISYVHNAS